MTQVEDNRNVGAPRASDMDKHTTLAKILTNRSSTNLSSRSMVFEQDAQDLAHSTQGAEVEEDPVLRSPRTDGVVHEDDAHLARAVVPDILYTEQHSHTVGTDATERYAQQPLGLAQGLNGESGWVGEPQQRNALEYDSVNGDAISVPIPPNDASIADIAFIDSAASVVESEGPRIQAFAKLEFDDGQFYMNTHSVELGRDIRAARALIHHDLEANHGGEVQRHRRSNSSADASQNPRRLKHEENRKMAGSVVSESGGIMGVDMPSTERRRRSKTRKPKSTSSSSHNLSRKNSMLVSAPQTDYQSLAMASLSNGAYRAQPVDTLALLPSPDECPLIPIHPPTVADGSTSGHRGISRRHVKIAYNFEKRLFEVQVLGKNGAFVDEQFYGEGEVQELKSGSYIQIGGVGVKFVLPDVAVGETGAESHVGSDPLSAGAMSFDFEDGRGESVTMADSSEETTGEDDDSNHNDDKLVGTYHHDSPKASIELDENGERQVDENEDEEEDSGEDEDEEIAESQPVRRRAANRVAKRPKKPLKPSKPTIKLKLKTKPPLEVDPEPAPKAEQVIPPPKRKGPGRPPKNGIISKREQALIARAAREAAKAEAIKNGLIKTGKGQSGNGNNGLSSVGHGFDGKVEKRKYTKRKKAEEATDEGDGVRETTAKTDSMPPEQILAAPPHKPAKEKRPPKPPRSPSPVWDESTLTAEQLAKPSQSYVVLIHEALTNSKTGAMSLPQIYRAIERRYPFYKLRVTTTGWQSSVRHNLSQHPAFRKIERDGKGWMWGLVPEISIEKEKRRRLSPPPMRPPGYYPPGPHMYRHPYPYPGMPPPNGHLPPLPPGYPPYGMHPGMPPPPPGRGFPPGHVGIPRGSNGLPLPLVPPQDEQSSTYRSPYTPAPQSQPTQSSVPSASTLPIAQPQLEQPQSSHPQQPSSISPPPQQSHDSLQPHQSHTLSQAHTGSVDKNSNLSQQSTSPPAPPPYYQTPQPHPPSSSQAQHLASPQTTMASSLLDAVAKFKTALIASMPEKPNAEEVVTQAINRTLGIIPPQSDTSATKEYPEEKAIMQALTNMLSAISKKEKEKEKEKEKASRQASNPPPLQPPNERQMQNPQPQNQSLNHERPMPSPQGTQVQAQLQQLLQQIDKPASTPSSALLHPIPQSHEGGVAHMSSQSNGVLPPSAETTASLKTNASANKDTQSTAKVEPELERGVKTEDRLSSEPFNGLKGSKRALEEEDDDEEEERRTAAGEVGAEGRVLKRVAA